MIYKFFDGRHIDLARILEIGPVNRNFGPWRFWFNIQFQLRDNAIEYSYLVKDLAPAEYLAWQEGQREPYDHGRQGALRDAIWEAASTKINEHHTQLVRAWKANVID